MNDFMIKILRRVISVTLPKAQYRKTRRQEYNVEMSDGAKLYCSVIMPDAKGPFPCILISNPYVVGENAYELGIMPVFASYGYAVIYRRCRGCLQSGGEWLPFENEARDGKEMIDWIAKQPFCDGNIGTYGGSYCGHTQWTLADTDNPAFKTAFISVFGLDGYRMYYRRGMFKLDLWANWAATMMEDNRYKETFPVEFVHKAVYTQPQSIMPQVIVGKDYSWYESWISSEKETDTYWNEGFWKENADRAKNIKVPIYLHGGWFDPFILPELEAFRSLPEEVRNRSRMIIGPWGHNGQAVKDALKFPGEGKAGFLQTKIALEWFDYMLKGKPYCRALGAIDTYSIRENKWIEWQGDIHPDAVKTLFFDSRRANADGKATILADKPAVKESSITYTYDPKHPTRTCGGNVFNSVDMTAGVGKCCVVQPKCGERESSICFVSDPFTEDARIAGQITAHLFVSSTAEATAFQVIVMELMPNGKSVNIRDDITDIRYLDEHVYKTYVPGSVVEIRLPMVDCEWMIKAGSRIRVDISSSNYPAFHAHPNLAENWGHTDKSVIAKQTLYMGEKYPSRIEFPLSTVK